MAWLPDGEKKFEHIFIRFDATHERDGQTHRQTDRQTPHDGIVRAYASHRAAKLYPIDKVMPVRFFTYLVSYSWLS